MRRLTILLLWGTVLAAPTTKPHDFSKDTLTELYAARNECAREIARLNGVLARINAEIGKRLAAKTKAENVLIRSMPGGARKPDEVKILTYEAETFDESER